MPPLRIQLFSIVLCLVLVGMSTVADAQSGAMAPSPAAKSQRDGIAVEDVIKLSKAGLSDDVIIAQIRKRPQPFDLTPDQLLQIKAARVSDRVIEAMTGKTPATAQVGSNVTGRGPEQPLDLPASTPIRDDNSRAPQWASSKESDPLTEKSYMLYVLTGRYLTAPSEGTSTAPHISLRCDPSPHHKLSGHLLAGFIDVGTVIDLEDGQLSTVKYRLNDGKVQTATYFEVGNSTNYQAISIKDIFLDNLLWGHMLTHKPHSGGQVHKVVVSVREHLDGDVVMQFDMPDAGEVGAACGTEYRK